jgi:hypothetical protein
VYRHVSLREYRRDQSEIDLIFVKIEAIDFLHMEVVTQPLQMFPGRNVVCIYEGRYNPGAEQCARKAGATGVLFMNENDWETQMARDFDTFLQPAECAMG